MIVLKVNQVVQKGFREIVVTLCDKDLIGERISEDFVIREKFYLGELCDDVNKLKNAISLSSTVNAVGAESVNFLKNNNFVDDTGIVFIGEKRIPHAIIISGEVF